MIQLTRQDTSKPGLYLQAGVADRLGLVYVGTNSPDDGSVYLDPTAARESGEGLIELARQSEERAR